MSLLTRTFVLLILLVGVGTAHGYVTVPSSDSDGKFKMSVTAPYHPYTNVIVQRKLGSGSWSTIYDNTSGGSVSQTVTNNGIYYYRAQLVQKVYGSTVNGTGYGSTDSITINFIPGKPGGLKTSDSSPSTDGTYSVTWNAASHAVKYQWREKVNSGAWSGWINTTSRSFGRSKNNGTYYYHVRACNSAGQCGSYSSTSIVVIKNSAPSISTTEATSTDGTYTLSWTGGAHNGVTNTSDLAYKFDELKPGDSWRNIQSNQGRSIALTRNTKNGDYYYRVRVCNITKNYTTLPNGDRVYIGFSWGACGSYSANRHVKVSIPAPAPVTGLHSTETTSGDGGYSIKWSASSGASSYQWREKLNNGNWSGWLSTSSTSIVRSGKGNGTYYYEVKACKPVACSGVASASMVVNRIPGTPSGLKVNGTAPYTGGSYSISWNATTYAVKYKWREKVGSGTWSGWIENTSRSVSRTKSTGNYYYEVIACNSINWCSSAASTSLTVIKNAAPSISTSETTSTDGTYTLSWTGGAHGGVTDTSNLAYKFDELQPGGSWSNIQSNQGRSISLTRNTKNGDYYYRVRVCNITKNYTSLPNGDKVYTGFSWGACGGYSSNRHVKVSIPAPVKVTNLKVSENPSLDGTYSVSWSAVSGAANYRWQEKLNSGTWSGWNYTSSTSFSRSKGNGTYYYNVQSCKPVACSGSVSTSTQVVKEAAPTMSTSTTNSTSGSYSISWTSGRADGESNSGNLLYKLEEKLGSGSWTSVLASVGTKSFGFTKSETNGSYSYRVAACTYDAIDTTVNGQVVLTRYESKICSAYSSVKTVTVAIPPPSKVSNLRVNNNPSLDGKFKVSWDAATGNIARYEWRENSGSWNDTTEVSTIHTGPEPTEVTTLHKEFSRNKGDGTYQYQVRACGLAGGCGDASSISVTVSRFASGTISTSTGTTTTGDFSVSWTVGRVDGKTSQSSMAFQLQQSINNGAWSTFKTFNQGMLGEELSYPPSLTIPKKTVNATYQYRVRSCLVTQKLNTDANEANGYEIVNVGECNAFSAPASVTVAITAPSAVRNLKVSPKPSLDGDFKVDWDSSTGIVDNYEWRKRTNGGAWGSWTSTTREQNHYAPNGDLTHTTYYKDTYFEQDNLTDGSYDFEIRACNSSAGCSTSSISNSVSRSEKPTMNALASVTETGEITIGWSGGRVDKTTAQSQFAYLVQESFNNGSWNTIIEADSKSMGSKLSTPPVVDLPTKSTNGYYKYRVKACIIQSSHDTDNNPDNGPELLVLSTCTEFSDASSSVQVDIKPPSRISGLYITPNPSLDGDFKMKWNESTGIVNNYEWSRETSPGVWSAYESTTREEKVYEGDTYLFSIYHKDTEVHFDDESDGIHRFRVRSCNTPTGCTETAETSVTVSKNYPPNLSSSKAYSTDGKFRLSWDMGNLNGLRYHSNYVSILERKLSTETTWKRISPEVITKDTSELNKSYFDEETDLINGLYNYRVKVCPANLISNGGSGEYIYEYFACTEFSKALTVDVDFPVIGYSLSATNSINGRFNVVINNALYSDESYERVFVERKLKDDPDWDLIEITQGSSVVPQVLPNGVYQYRIIEMGLKDGSYESVSPEYSPIQEVTVNIPAQQVGSQQFTLDESIVRAYLEDPDNQGKPAGQYLADKLVDEVNTIGLPVDVNNFEFPTTVNGLAYLGGRCSDSNYQQTIEWMNRPSSAAKYYSIHQPFRSKVSIAGNLEADGQFESKSVMVIIGECVAHYGETDFVSIDAELLLTADASFFPNPEMSFAGNGDIEITFSPELQLNGGVQALADLNIEMTESWKLLPVFPQEILVGSLLSEFNHLTFNHEYLNEDFTSITKMNSLTQKRLNLTLLNIEANLNTKLDDLTAKIKIPQHSAYSQEIKGFLLNEISEYPLAFPVGDTYLGGIDPIQEQKREYLLLGAILSGDIEGVENILSQQSVCTESYSEFVSYDLVVAAYPSNHSSQSINDYCSEMMASGMELANPLNWGAGHNSESGWTEAWGAQLDIQGTDKTANHLPFVNKVVYKEVAEKSAPKPQFCFNGGCTDWSNAAVGDDGTCKLEMRIYKNDADAIDTKPMLAVYDGWTNRANGLLNLEARISEFTESGYTVFAPVYRVLGNNNVTSDCDNATGDDLITDIKDAFTWIETNKANYGASGKISIFAEATGAPLALSIANTEAEKIDKSLLLRPITDLSRAVEDNQKGIIYSDELVESILAFTGNSSVSMKTLDYSSTNLLKHSYPTKFIGTSSKFFVVTGESPNQVPASQSERFCNALSGNIDRQPPLDENGVREAVFVKSVYKCNSDSWLDIFEDGHKLESCLLPDRYCKIDAQDWSQSSFENTVAEYLQWLIGSETRSPAKSVLY